jgi:lipid-A-disaccharide synthase
MQRARKVFIIAGEASGDFLGKDLLANLKAMHENLEFRGVGGAQMAKEGLFSIFPMQELSVMGIGEVLPHIPKILNRIKQTKEAIKNFNPDVVVTIDSPGFTLRIAEYVKTELKILVVHYVAPSVWAWRPGRAKKITQKVDHLLCLLPFEPEYFTKHGLKATFVGHPVTNINLPSDLNFRAQVGLNRESTLVCILPGSRVSEIKNLTHTFLEAVAKLPLNRRIEIIIPTLPHLKEVVERQLAEVCSDVVIVTTDSLKWQAFMQSSIALAASGTVSLELAYVGVPQVIAYKVNFLTYWLAKLLVKTKFVSLVNILAGHSIVPECLQSKCNPDELAYQLERILSNSTHQKNMRLAYKNVIEKITPQHGTPGNMAAAVVSGYFK